MRENTMTNAKVWVVQEGLNDYQPAEQFGEVNFITDQEYSSIPHSKVNEVVHADIKKFLSLYVPGIDFIVPAGNPMVVSRVILALPNTDHRFLKWDGRKGIYVPYLLTDAI